MELIKVTCAIIERADAILVVQRGAHMKLPFKWEFPGGKQEHAESEEDCIKREIMEELNIEIELLERLTPTTHFYPHISVMLIPFRAKYLSGEITLHEHKQFLFLPPNRLMDLDWVEADLPIVREYLLIWS